MAANGRAPARVLAGAHLKELSRCRRVSVGLEAAPVLHVGWRTGRPSTVRASVRDVAQGWRVAEISLAEGVTEAIAVTQDQHNPVAGRPANTVPTRTKRYLPVRSGTAANIGVSSPFRSLPSSGNPSVLDPLRRHVTTGLLVSGRSAVRIRSPAQRQSISDVRKCDLVIPGAPSARCARRL